jgi:hypothetical protein
MSLATGGELEIRLNDEVRNLLIRELQSLSEKNNEHFHLSAWGDAEVRLSGNAYRPNDKIIGAAKILFRTDEWDRQYYPHVLDGKN